MNKRKTKRIGQILCERALITELQLEHALKVQKVLEKGRQLGQILIDLGYITKTQLDNAIDVQDKLKNSKKIKVLHQV